MKSALLIAVLGWATLTTAAYAAQESASCQEELAKVKQTYSTHQHQKGGSEGVNWAQIDAAIKQAEKDCAAGKSKEAYDQLNLANRWLAAPQHTRH